MYMAMRLVVKQELPKKLLMVFILQEKINTFAAIFPTSKPKYVLIVLLDEPKINSEYIYHYRDGSGFKLKGSP